jgi:phosphoribosyl 1,2-cyclic phosphate phosphodiesterase
MRFTFLGTGAAEAIPDPFCRCRVCEIARRERGAHIRARSAALVNDDILIDMGPDLLTSANKAGAYLGGLKALLVTHRHDDHWLPGNLYWRKPGFTPTPTEPMTVYAPADALADITDELAESANFTWKSVTAGDTWDVGSYKITAIPATHGGGYLEPLLYVIEQDGRRCFYSTDTAPMSEAAYEMLRTFGPMGLIALDATTGDQPGGDGHHSFEAFLETRTRLIAEGVMVPGQTQLYAHHFSHNGHMTYDELVKAYGQYGVGVSYDSLVLEL